MPDPENATSGEPSNAPKIDIVKSGDDHAALAGKTSAVAALEEWFDRHIRNSPYSADTATHNEIHAHLHRIKAILEAKGNS